MLKTLLKRFVPIPLLSMYRRARIGRIRQANKMLPVKEVFRSIYRKNQWGGRKGEFCSGSGSTKKHAVVYSEVVRQFVQQNEVSTIVDLGCGDFTIGNQLLMEGVKYIGVDIVDELIENNRSTHANENVTFLCRDIIADELPSGDLCLIRQVLQHLSNSQILTILQKLQKYRFVMITEHYPSPRVKCVPNMDKPHGFDTRIVDNSAVYLDQLPFKQSNLTQILEVKSARGTVYPDEPLRTFLIDNCGENQTSTVRDYVRRQVA